MQQLTGRRVTVMGLGRHGGGLAAAQWLAGQGALVTVTDLATADSLGTSLEKLRGVPIARYRLGEHQAEDFIGADLLVVNPAVRPRHPLVVAAAASGAVITSEIELFLERCQATVVGITGSNGKSTAATMLAAVLWACDRRAWLGGNIGASLLGDLPVIRPADVVVLELSSFQLASLSPAARMPGMAIVTNCTPNHLDWHGSMAAYVAAKQRLVRGLTARGALVLGPSAAELDAWASLAEARILLRPGMSVPELPALRIAGDHNRANAACVAAAALDLGCERSTAMRVLAEFSGLRHRLQLVATISGRRIYNDSKATSAAAAQAALTAVPGPTWWLAGGLAKGVEFGPLAEHVVRHARGAALFGAARESLAEALSAADRHFPVHVEARMPEALLWCWRRSASGDAILLSPACASHDQFVDYEDRGDQFVELVQRLQ
jgi:UDP-N-acetylmuramoylalanine--D-glutamate ligase